MEDTQQRPELLHRPGCLHKVLVIGAGVAGLQTLRQLLKLGIQVLVLEASSDVGGVWMRGYEGYGLQIPWRHYQFPEFLWPKEIQPKDEYPSGQQVQRYIKAYAHHFDLMRHIRLNCKLLRLRWCADTREWEAIYCDSTLEKFYKTKADYTVICSGLYSQPYVPEYKGVDTFAGTQMHAQDFVDLSLAKGRRVVIVGAGKTALDCVCGLVASRTAASVTMLFRQLHWPMPRTILGISIRSLLFNRATPAMLPPYYTDGPGARATHALLRPLKRLFWRSIEVASSRKFHLQAGCEPRVGLPDDMFYGGQILDDSTAEVMRCETLTTIKGEITRFVRNGVILQDGDFLPADLVLYCTGYAKTYEYFDGETRSRLGLQKDGLYLYRNCLPCGVPHLAFVGSEVSTYSNILTHGLQALWLAGVLSGRVKLPPQADMAADVRAQQHWRRRVMPAQRNRGSVLMLYGVRYHDQLLHDLGHSSRRKSLFAECFGTYSAEEYSELMGGGRPRAASCTPAGGVAAATEAAVEVSQRGARWSTACDAASPAADLVPWAAAAGEVEAEAAATADAERPTPPLVPCRQSTGARDCGERASTGFCAAAGSYESRAGGAGRRRRCCSAMDEHAAAIAAALAAGSSPRAGRAHSEGAMRHRAIAAAVASSPAGSDCQLPLAGHVNLGRAFASERALSAVATAVAMDLGAMPAMGRTGAASGLTSRQQACAAPAAAAVVWPRPRPPAVGRSESDGAARSRTVGAVGTVGPSALLPVQAAPTSVAPGSGEVVLALTRLVRSTSWDARSSGGATPPSECTGTAATVPWGGDGTSPCAPCAACCAASGAGACGSCSHGGSWGVRDLSSGSAPAGPRPAHAHAQCRCGCGRGFVISCAVVGNAEAQGETREVPTAQTDERPLMAPAAEAADASGAAAPDRTSSPLPSAGIGAVAAAAAGACGHRQDYQRPQLGAQLTSPPPPLCCAACGVAQTVSSEGWYGAGGAAGSFGRRSSGSERGALPPPCSLGSPRNAHAPWHPSSPSAHQPPACYRRAYGERRPSMARLPEEEGPSCG